MQQPVLQQRVMATPEPLKVGLIADDVSTGKCVDETLRWANGWIHVCSPELVIFGPGTDELIDVQPKTVVQILAVLLANYTD